MFPKMKAVLEKVRKHPEEGEIGKAWFEARHREEPTGGWEKWWLKGETLLRFFEKVRRNRGQEGNHGHKSRQWLGGLAQVT